MFVLAYNGVKRGKTFTSNGQIQSQKCKQVSLGFGVVDAIACIKLCFTPGAAETRNRILKHVEMILNEKKHLYV